MLATPGLFVRCSLSAGTGRSFVALRFDGKDDEEGDAGRGSPVIEERISLISESSAHKSYGLTWEPTGILNDTDDSERGDRMGIGHATVADRDVLYYENIWCA